MSTILGAADTELIGLLGLQNAGQENRYGRSYSGMFEKTFDNSKIVQKSVFKYFSPNLQDDNYSTHLNRDFTTGNYQDAISQSRDNSNNQLNCVFAFNRKRKKTSDVNEILTKITFFCQETPLRTMIYSAGMAENDSRTICFLNLNLVSSNQNLNE